MMTNRRAGVIFFFFTLILSILIIIWTLFINKGTLTISGEMPFFVSVPSESEYFCEIDPCSERLSPGKYKVTVRKNGYSDEMFDLEVNRWKESKFTVNFRFIPVLESLNLRAPYSLPEGYEEFLSSINDISLTAFQDISKDLNSLPGSPKYAAFSPQGSYLFVNNASKSKIINLKDEEETVVDFGLDAKPVWSNSESKMAYLKTNEDNKNLTLYLYDIASGESEIVTAFLRNFKEYKMFFSDQADKLIVVDMESKPNEVFLIDLTDKSKNVLFVVPGMQQLKWSKSGNYFVYSNATDSVFSTHLYDLKNDTTTDININLNLNKIDFNKDDNIVFVSSDSNKQAEENEDIGVSFSDAIEMVNAGLSEENAATPQSEEIITGSAGQQYFIVYDIQNKTFTDLSSVSADKNIAIERMELSEDDSKIYFWTGVSLYEIRLSEG